MFRSRSPTTAEIRPAPQRRRVLVAAAVALAVTAADVEGGWFKRAPADGTIVRVEGAVTDTQGAPLPGVTVTLEAARRHWSFRERGQLAATAPALVATTGVDGRFAFDWAWRPDYPRLEIAASVTQRVASGQRVEVLATSDLSRRVGLGSPVVVTLVVEDDAFAASWRSFVAGLESADERRLFAEWGKPDAIDLRLAGARRETAWWYYGAGRVLRFADRRLTEIEEFRPVAVPSAVEGGA